jgi:hypothetical protein
MKFYFWIFLENSINKIQISLKTDKNTLHEHQYTFLS